ncbi:AsmA-like C-terminal region-containing protein [bacterium]
MKKKLKVIFISLLILGVLIGAGLLALKIFFPAEKIKQIIETKASEMFARKVEIGSVSLDSIGIKLKSVKVFEDSGQDLFMEAANVQVKFQLLGLIKKKAKPSNIIIESPKIRIIKSADSKYNFYSLGKEGFSAQKREDKWDIKYLAAIPILASDIEIRSAEISYDDKTTKDKPIRITGFALKTSNFSILKPFNIELKSDGTQKYNRFFRTALNGSLKLDAKIDIANKIVNLRQLLINLNNVQVESKGELDFTEDMFKVDLKVTSEKFNINDFLKLFERQIKLSKELDISGSAILDFKVKGMFNEVLNLNGNINLTDTVINYKKYFNKNNLTSSELDFDIAVNQMKVINIKKIKTNLHEVKFSSEGTLDYTAKKPKVRLNLSSDNVDLALCPNFSDILKLYDLKGSMNLELFYINSVNLNKFEGTVFLNNTHFRINNTIIDDLKTKIFYKSDSLKIDYIKALINNEPFAFNLSVDDFKNPIGSAKLNLTGVDFDDVLERSNIQSDEEEKVQVKPIKSKKVDEKKQLLLPEFLRNADFSWDFNLKNITFRNILFDSLEGNIQFKNSIVVLNPIQIRTSEGKIKGKVTVALVRLDEVDYLVNVNMKSLNVYKFLSMYGMYSKNITSGTLDANLKIRGRGMMWGKLYSRGDIKAKNVTLKDVEVLANIGNILKMPAFNEVNYNNISSTFEIKNSLLKTQDFTMNSDLMDVYSKGAVNIVNSKLDLLTTVKLPEGVIGGTLADLNKDKKGRVSPSFKITGTIKEPKYQYLISDKVLENGKRMLEELFK